ncbi:MAG: hypothetical protein KDD82_15570, partial [Planctomycetes bacterium]|nr:hypothetical protein [Planctomycetota bacterium]
ARLLAQAWGYSGPATCWVGGADAELARLLDAHRARGEQVVCVRVRDVNGAFRISWGGEERT